MPVDSFPESSEDVLNDLDPLSRALLDLSVQKGMNDAEIAEVLGTDEESVYEVKVGLLRNLAAKVAPDKADAELPELQAAVAAELYPPEDETAVEADELGDEVDEAELETEPELETEAAPEPAEAEAPALAEPATAGERRRRSPLVFLLPLLLLACIAALVIALAGGSDDDGGDKAEPAKPAAENQQPAPAKKPRPRPVRLTAVGSGGARGTAALEGNRLTLKLRGLPDPDGGAYQVWLYNSVIDAKPLFRSRDTKVQVEAKLPGNANKYEFVDVSLEPADGNPNHSGHSVLRVPLKNLER